MIGNAPRTMRIRVLMGFYMDGKAQPEGAILTVPYSFGAEMISANRAERVADEPEAEPTKRSRKGDA